MAAKSKEIYESMQEIREKVSILYVVFLSSSKDFLLLQSTTVYFFLGVRLNRPLPCKTRKSNKEEEAKMENHWQQQERTAKLVRAATRSEYTGDREVVYVFERGGCSACFLHCN